MKIKQVSTFAVSVMFMALGLAGCDSIDCKNGSGKQITETRKLGDFSKLEISGGYKVIIKQDTVSSLAITADDNLIEYIKSDVDGNKLTIKTKKSICSTGKLVLNISLRDISSIRTSGAVDVTSDGKITTKDLLIDLSGASKITLNLNADKVTTTGSGLTEINLTGQATEHNVQLSGGGQINALDFVVGKYTIETSGASHCKINVLNELNINSSGASDIEYRGNPSTIHNDKSGALSLKKVD